MYANICAMLSTVHNICSIMRALLRDYEILF